MDPHVLNVGVSFSEPKDPRRILSPELWLEVFKHIAIRQNFPEFLHDECSDLQDVTLTCPLFRRLAQPLLFQFLRFDFARLANTSSMSEYSVLDENPGYDIQSKQRFLQRIDFCMSHRIAHAVRSCEIISSPTSTDIFRDHLLSLLPLLINLQSLTLTTARPNRTYMVSLESFMLSDYGLLLPSFDPTLPMLNAADVPIAPHPTPLRRFQTAFSCFHADYVRSLTFENWNPAESFKRTLGSAGRRFALPSVRSPGLLFYLYSILNIITTLFIQLCPCLEERVYEYALVDNSEDRGDFPAALQPMVKVIPLKKFEGPSDLFCWFVRGNGLRRLVLRGILQPDGYIYDDSSELAALLKEYRSRLKQVEALALNVNILNRPLLASICSNFPNLQTVYIQMQYPLVDGENWTSYYSVQSLLEEFIMRKLQLPRSIRKLHIEHWATLMCQDQHTLEPSHFSLAEQMKETYPGMSVEALNEDEILMYWDCREKMMVDGSAANNIHFSSAVQAFELGG